MSIFGLPWWALAIIAGLAAWSVFQAADSIAAIVSRRRHRQVRGPRHRR